MTDNVTREEIFAQPALWARTTARVADRADEILDFIRRTDISEAIFTGCGTSFYISIAAAAFFQEITGLTARAVPASEVVLNPASVLHAGKQTLLVAASRSGETTELVRAVASVQSRPNIRTLAVTANPDSELIAHADFSLVLEYIREKSVVMTSSFTSILLALEMIPLLLRGRLDLPALDSTLAQGAARIQEFDLLARRLGEDLTRDHFIYLGLGSNYGLACEGMLKMKEMTQVTSEAFTTMEFRHGPISVVHDRCVAVVLASSSAMRYECDLVEDLRALGAFTVVIGDSGQNPYPADVRLSGDSPLPSALCALTGVPFLQLLACHRAVKLGLNPDRPRHLNSVVTLGWQTGG